MLLCQRPHAWCSFADEDIERQVGELRAKLLKQSAAADTKKECVAVTGFLLAWYCIGPSDMRQSCGFTA
jgi:hypothetical protein